MSEPIETQLCFSVSSIEFGQVFTLGNDVRFALAVKDALGQYFPASYWSVNPVILASLPLPATGKDLAAFAKDIKKNQV